ncbi:TetR/AcrR family transcriptional regulator [Streptomyces tsukubensis]|uniref:TetR family transcriptional regulator n=1 Tax=Streptomyces tsukubensis TaxID=83656 RepID=A0A1V4AD74_9ACTN|nr:TetR family transcriptional regulator [Streptomyces tsukubensis]OON81400.1 TetR family transcriptional regulator [Streptomyces tsukubensis]QFR95470.1 TetR family transcriptional regulator [Streptomyces tsukubensis]
MKAARTPVPDTRVSNAQDSAPRLGLRERKKIKTRQAIRGAAYRLIKERGYEATTVELIAEAAEFSMSTVFRYFPTKEDIVLTDEYDPMIESALRARPADESLVESMRQVMRQSFAAVIADDYDELVIRSTLMNEVPAVRSRMTEGMTATGRILCDVIADRLGRDPEELEIRSVTMGLIGALTETVLYWAQHGHKDDLADLVDRVLAPFSRGFEL